MLRRLVLWLLRMLEEYLDPDLKAELDQYRKRKAELEAQIKETQEAISGLDDKLTQLHTQRAATQSELADAERESSRIEEEREGVLNEKTDRNVSSDHDALSDRL